MVAHCLASSTGSRNASDTTFMPNFMRRVRPAKAAIVVIDSRNGWRLTIRSVCQIESTPPASHMSIQRQYAAAPENGNSAQPNPIPTPMRRLSARGHRRRGFDAPRDVAHEAFKTAVHLLWPHARRHCPSDEIGDAVLAHKACQLSHAVLDVADHPCLRDAGLARVARNAAGGALVLVEAAVDLAAIALGGAHGRPVVLGIVGYEAGADDADTIVVGIAARRLRIARHGSSTFSRAPCGRKLLSLRAARCAPGSDIAAIQSGGPPGCT